jgi:hypothetical protein
VYVHVYVLLCKQQARKVYAYMVQLIVGVLSEALRISVRAFLLSVLTDFPKNKSETTYNKIYAKL